MNARAAASGRISEVFKDWPLALLFSLCCAFDLISEPNPASLPLGSGVAFLNCLPVVWRIAKAHKDVTALLNLARRFMFLRKCLVREIEAAWWRLVGAFECISEI